MDSCRLLARLVGQLSVLLGRLVGQLSVLLGRLAGTVVGWLDPVGTAVGWGRGLLTLSRLTGRRLSPPGPARRPHISCGKA